MRKLFTLTAVVLGVLTSLSSCKHNEPLDVSINDEQMVMLNVTIPESETRASETNSTQGIFNNNVLGDENDNNTMRYILQIFDDAGRPSDETLIEYSDGTTVSFPVRLVPGRDYTFVVWADFVTNGETNTDNHYITKDANGKTDLRNITINEDSWVAMDETRDAFTGIYSTKAVGEKYNGASTIDVELTRPFAKVRVVTTDLVALANLGIKPDYATVEYTTPYRAGFNALTCQPFEAEQNDKKTHQVSDSEAFAIVAYGDNTAANKVLFTDYLFASADQNDVVKFDLSVYEKADKSGPIKSNSFSTDIAIKRNHLTTISGNILTEGGTVNVVIDPTFGGYIDEEYPFDNTIDPNKAIYYTATSKVEKNSWTFDTFGANIVSNTWNESTGEGVIVFDSEVTKIGDYGFDNCDNLKTISFNNSITTIGRYAFQGCDLLSQIVIPGNIQKVGYLAFVNCTNVSSIVIEAGDTELWVEYSFDNIASTTLYVDRDLHGGLNYSPFENVGISTISIGPNMKNINVYVFSNCDQIQSINICSESQLKKIGYCAFYNSNINGLRIPNSVTEIDSTAFAMTTGMGWFVGGSSVYWVGMNGELAYEEASLRILLRWPSEFSYSTSIVSSYNYDKIGAYSFAGIDNLRYFEIAMYDGNTIEIDDCAFWHCENLESFKGVVAAGAKMNISAIGSTVFGYTAIEELDFLDSSFTSIERTFRQCFALKTLFLPKTLAYIGENTFEGCDNLVNLYLAATIPPSLSPDAFNIISDGLIIYVPTESIDAYKTAAGWSDYADQIVGYNFE